MAPISSSAKKTRVWYAVLVGNGRLPGNEGKKKKKARKPGDGYTWELQR